MCHELSCLKCVSRCAGVCTYVYVVVCFTVGPPLKFSGGLSVVLEPDSVHVQCVCESNGHSLFRIQAVYQERRDFYTSRVNIGN